MVGGGARWWCQVVGGGRWHGTSRSMATRVASTVGDAMAARATAPVVQPERWQAQIRLIRLRIHGSIRSSGRTWAVDEHDGGKGGRRGGGQSGWVSFSTLLVLLVLVVSRPPTATSTPAPAPPLAFALERRISGGGRRPPPRHADATPRHAVPHRAVSVQMCQISPPAPHPTTTAAAASENKVFLHPLAIIGMSGQWATAG